MQWYQVYKVIILKPVSNVSFSLSNNETYLSILFIVVEKVFYSQIMTITRSDELCHSPATRDTKSSSRVIAIIIRSLNNILF
jgi:hypothetical protein